MACLMGVFCWFEFVEEESASTTEVCFSGFALDADGIFNTIFIEY